MSASKQNKISRWYFGGIASGGAACVTHPLDLLKVTLQTQQEGKLSMFQLVGKVIRQQGVFALYSGISASLLRQMTYSTTRFGIYEVGKQHLGNDAGFIAKILLAGGAGAAGGKTFIEGKKWWTNIINLRVLIGLVGTPADMVNVRMQNDVKLPPEQRRKWVLLIELIERKNKNKTDQIDNCSYKNAIDGLLRVRREEGFRRLFSGATTATGRGFMMNIGQIAFYEQVKILLLNTGYFKDDPGTHFLSSLTAGGIATALTQPLDVLKTRAMNAKPGEFANQWAIVTHTAKLGPMGFFKGFVPAFVRLGPHTVITLMLLEQLRLNFGYFPSLAPLQKL